MTACVGVNSGHHGAVAAVALHQVLNLLPVQIEAAFQQLNIISELRAVQIAPTLGLGHAFIMQLLELVHRGIAKRGRFSVDAVDFLRRDVSAVPLFGFRLFFTLPLHLGIKAGKDILHLGNISVHNKSPLCNDFLRDSEIISPFLFQIAFEQFRSILCRGRHGRSRTTSGRRLDSGLCLVFRYNKHGAHKEYSTPVFQPLHRLRSVKIL